MAADGLTHGLLFASRLCAGTATSPRVTEKDDFHSISLVEDFLRLFRDLDVVGRVSPYHLDPFQPHCKAMPSRLSVRQL